MADRTEKHIHSRDSPRRAQSRMSANCARTGGGSVTLIVQETGLYDVFLPLVLRNY